VRLGEFVPREACAQTVRWRDAGLLPDPFVTWVNVSGKQVATGQLHRVVEQVLEDTDSSPRGSARDHRGRR